MADTELYTRRRLGLFQALAYAADDPLVAVVGPATGDELTAFAKGVRRPHPLRKGSAAGSVLCFHGPNVGRQVRAAQRSIVNYTARTTARISTPIALVVRFVQAADAERGRWQTEIARLQRAGPMRFGLICHMGNYPKGQDAMARRDLDLLMPMMSDRTMLVLCGMERTRPQRLLRSLLANGGWSTLWWQSLGLAALGRLPFAS